MEKRRDRRGDGGREGDRDGGRVNSTVAPRECGIGQLAYRDSTHILF